MVFPMKKLLLLAAVALVAVTAAAAGGVLRFLDIGNPGSGGASPLLLEVEARTVFDGMDPGMALPGDGAETRPEPTPGDAVFLRASLRSGEMPRDHLETGIASFPAAMDVLRESPVFSGLPLELVRRSEEGRISLRVADEIFVLAPGEDLALGVVPRDSTFAVETEESTWRNQLEAALEAAEPALVLRVANRGALDAGGGERP